MFWSWHNIFMLQEKTLWLKNIIKYLPESAWWAGCGARSSCCCPGPALRHLWLETSAAAHKSRLYSGARRRAGRSGGRAADALIRPGEDVGEQSRPASHCSLRPHRSLESAHHFPHWYRVPVWSFILLRSLRSMCRDDEAGTGHQFSVWRQHKQFSGETDLAAFIPGQQKLIKTIQRNSSVSEVRPEYQCR